MSFLPAVYNHGARVGWGQSFHPAHEEQKGRGMVRDSVVRPRRELELSYFPFLRVGILEIEKSSNLFSKE